MPLAKKIRIKKVTHQSENFSSKITNMKKDKFKSADRLLLNKLSPHVVVKSLKNILNEKEFYEKSKEIFVKFFSLNELFYIENFPLDDSYINSLNDFECFLVPFILRDLDLLKGIYKNYYLFYKIEEIEYEEYDRLNEFLKDEKLYKNYSSLNRNPFINGFYIDKNTEVEFIKERDNPAITNLDLFTRLLFIFNNLKGYLFND